MNDIEQEEHIRLNQEQIILLETITPDMSRKDQNEVYKQVRQIQRKINQLLGLQGKS